MAEPVNQTGPSPQQPLHQLDADEDDDNVKQLKQCSSPHRNALLIPTETGNLAKRACYEFILCSILHRYF
ncbi:hypothetical protein OIU79_007410 [Salix purpurea]|uniref:Uncharacterized protein n=1 Tax=Salix purpurea TaxID=77065 RepID=A0A9Q0TXS8_SALPP|nr:hypothetical protein OIU79_007410 [Salix purpurea]